MPRKKRVGLALSGGGGRGFAHIGVLKVLEEKGIKVDFISGTSMGALISAMYSMNPNAKILEKEVLDKDWKEFFSYRFFKGNSFMSEDNFEEYLKSLFGKLKFKDTKIPLFITAVDIKEVREVIFSKGNIAKAVRASMAAPGVFPPVGNKDRILVDGGILDPIPTEILKKKGADVIIAVNVNHRPPRKFITNEPATSRKVNVENVPIMRNILTSFGIMMSEFSRMDLNENEKHIDVNVPLPGITSLDFSHAKKAIKAGEDAARKHLPKKV